MDVPLLNATIQELSETEDVHKILHILRPTWNEKDTEITRLTGGITNKLLRCVNKINSNDIILIRVYGNNTDLIIDRESEIKNLKELYLAGQAPSLYGIFNNGFAYEYISGEVLTAATCHLENIQEMVAKKLADMHSIKAVLSEKQPVLWSTIIKFLALVPVKFAKKEKEERFNALFPKRIKLENEYSFLERQLGCLESPVVFCHNDLLLANIIYNKEANSVSFIDFEYAAYNYQAYDIANHFNEYAGIEDANYSVFPDEAQQKKWLRIYLKHYSNKNGACDRFEVKEKDVNTLYETVQKYTLASHFLWGVWSLVQAEHSLIDFDFLKYAQVRFQEYFNRKRLIFPL